MINDLESDSLLFADDTTILATGSDPNMTTAKLNRDLENLSNCLLHGRLPLMPKNLKI